MFVLDRSATYTNTGLTKYEPAYKRAVAAGVQCALQDQLIRKDFYSNLYNKQVRSHKIGLFVCARNGCSRQNSVMLVTRKQSCDYFEF